MVNTKGYSQRIQIICTSCKILVTVNCDYRSNPCWNGGSCVTTEVPGKMFCVCPLGYNGDMCQFVGTIISTSFYVALILILKR